MSTPTTGTGATGTGPARGTNTATDEAVGGASTGITLAVTSSTGVMGIAIGEVDERSARTLGSVEITTDRQHAEELSPRLLALLDKTGLTLADVDRLVIDVGPGRFTGLRVGLASVRALGFALDRPVIGLTSLAVLAAGAAGDGGADAGGAGAGADVGPVTAVIDARRAEVFQQTFEAGMPVAAATVGDPEVLARSARGLVVGDGVDRYAEHYQTVEGVTVVGGRNPNAEVMLGLSQGVVGKPGTEVEPLYLRDPDANPNIKTRPGAS